ncbi:replication initiator [Krasilnikovia sp. MM14-A1004]|uniref:replication initiator n=1 Tax=Krasilnikovia sp. MM14-A1004 TaxID=3373541 RepID=UPI00399CE3D3
MDSTLDLVPREQSAQGTGSNAEPAWIPPFAASSTAGQALARASRADYFGWLSHVQAAAGCTRPIRLSGDIYTVARHGSGATILDHRHTDSLPDAAIYKACGNRRHSVCPSCARTYQRDAYQLLRAGLVGGKGVPTTVSRHPAVFLTLTAPGFGAVHTRRVSTHTCTDRKRCDCRPDPCHARRDHPAPCEHGQPVVCWVRHDADDPQLGQPLCLDCYDHDHHVVFNLHAAELWHRTKQAAERALAKLCRARGIPFIEVCTDGKTVRRIPPVRLSHGKAAEMQRRGAVHFHALVRLDGVNPGDLTAVVPPPAGIGLADLVDALDAAARETGFTTPGHPDRLDGWPMAWGEQLDIRPITLTGTGEVTDGMVAGYLAKYATKSTEATGHNSTRITADTIEQHGDPDGGHTARLIDACWRLGRPTTPTPITGYLLGLLAKQVTNKATPIADVLGLLAGLAVTYVRRKLIDRPRRAPQSGNRRLPFDTPWDCPDCGTHTRYRACPVCTAERQASLDTKHANTAGRATGYRRLRRWAHMLGYGGHFLTKARRYSITFRLLRDTRITYRRATEQANTDSGAIRAADHQSEETTLTVGTLTYAGVGWHTSGDAMLANTAAAMARARHEIGREELAHEIGTNPAAIEEAA